MATSTAPDEANLTRMTGGEDGGTGWAPKTFNMLHVRSLKLKTQTEEPCRVKGVEQHPACQYVHSLCLRPSLQARMATRLRVRGSGHGQCWCQKRPGVHVDGGATARSLLQVDGPARAVYGLPTYHLGVPPTKPTNKTGGEGGTAGALAGHLQCWCHKRLAGAAVQEAAAVDVLWGGGNVDRLCTALAPRPPHIPSCQLAGTCKHGNTR